MKQSPANPEYPFEPFRFKMIERIPLTRREDRARWLAGVDYNLMRLPSSRVTIDLLTDSGTGAMSDRQWAAMLEADEAYAFSRSFERLEAVVRELTGIEHVFPAHQGRSAEHLLFSALVRPGSVVPSNHHFSTTSENIRALGGTPVDVGAPEVELAADRNFAGNADIERLRRVIRDAGPERVPLAMMTLTDQEIGGQPVSIENLRAVRAVLDEYGIPLYLDIARYAENAYFIQQREPGWAGRPITEIARAVFDCATGVVMSAKKDAIVNMGGLIATRDTPTADRIVQRMTLVEGFPTYGGLAGRDLEAIAVGLTEGLDEDYLRHRTGQVAYLAERLTALGVPIIQPPGGHAVFVFAGDLLPALPAEADAAQTLVVELYLEAGIRSLVIGGPFRDTAHGGGVRGGQGSLVRLCIPWRTYGQSHLDAVAAAFAAIAQRAPEIRGYRPLPIDGGSVRFGPRWEPIR